MIASVSDEKQFDFINITKLLILKEFS